MPGGKASRSLLYKNSLLNDMSYKFNPLDSRLIFVKPERLCYGSTWNEHVPFAMLLTELQRPTMIVELGSQWGVSYCAFCQAVKAIGLDSKCCAVDTWAGDTHTGRYEDEIFEDLRDHHKQYESFSKLLRMTFDEALQHIPDGSVDLLHIDGLHTYEAVKHDYETWLPKMSEKGIVLFHDTMVKEREFGVHQLWNELSLKYSHFNFEHGFGLGILLTGRNQPQSVTGFMETANNNSSAIRELFSTLGRRLQLEIANKEIEPQTKRLIDYRVGNAILRPPRMLKRLLTGKQAR